AHNIRDLGGYAAAGGSETKWRAALRGDGLSRLSAGDRAMLLGEGLRTVIDLRSAHEMKAEPNPFEGHPNVWFHNIPLFGALAPIEAAKGATGRFDMAERYRDAVDRCQALIAELITTIASSEDGVVLFHCTAGKDRTGIIAALLLSLAGVDDDTIVNDYAMTASVAAPLLDRLRVEALARGGSAELIESFLTSEPMTMRILLDHVAHAHGGTTAYLSSIGLDRSTLEALRRRLTSPLL
ncbi:tyrosine-protein phosphatase, partial [Rhizobiaceae sp. 2RAB30]